MSTGSSICPDVQYREWLIRIQAGDREAEENVIETFSPMVHRMICAKLGYNHKDVADLMSDTIVEILITLRKKQFDPNQGKLQSYVYGITRNMITGYLRNHYRKFSKFETMDPQTTQIADEATQRNTLEQQERKQQLKGLIQSLKPQHRQALELRYMQELSIEDIMSIMDVKSESHLRNLISYGITLLRLKADKVNFFSIF